ncbi:MAG: citrate lyase subunit alpha [Eubacteriaceae bacterium]|jgi:citrate lyase subunit alpha/citrate CoA-transferase|nr:citrate lyase subunit alpha [Eubacteriaceae bacterium]
MINALNRNIPDAALGYGKHGVYNGAFEYRGCEKRVIVNSRTVLPKEKKLLNSLDEAIQLSGLKSGMTISFHHHLRNGDETMKKVLRAIEKKGIGDLTIAATALFDCHTFLEDYIRSGVVKNIQANYMSGGIAQRISCGLLDSPVIMRTHGGRDRAVESGDLHVDVAFIAAPAADEYGNLNAVDGPSAFGSFGYAYSDARYADCSIAITDNLMPYPLTYVSIDQTLIDYVVVVDKIGNQEGIVSGTTKMTRDPIGRKIAKLTAEVIKNSEYFKDGFSFQTGAGGVSLATAEYTHRYMLDKEVKGSFGLGGITKPMVDMLRDGCFDVLLDTQCFDLDAIESLKTNRRHREISCSTYSNMHTKGSVVNLLDIAVLGATEIDLDFNVNVTTGSDGTIIGGSGGHADAAAGSKMCIVVANLFRGRFPTVVNEVTTINTPGETVDVLVTECGIAVNPRRDDIIQCLRKTDLPLKTIAELKDIANKTCGIPEPLKTTDKIAAVVEYRDGTLLDVINCVE